MPSTDARAHGAATAPGRSRRVRFFHASVAGGAFFGLHQTSGRRVPRRRWQPVVAGAPRARRRLPAAPAVFLPTRHPLKRAGIVARHDVATARRRAVPAAAVTVTLVTRVQDVVGALPWQGRTDEPTRRRRRPPAVPPVTGPPRRL